MKNMLSIFKNREDEMIKEQVREIYSRIDSETPVDFHDLEKKHEFKFESVKENRGSFGHFYELPNNLGGKILYGRAPSGFHSPVKPKYAFEKLRKEYINHKIALEIDMAVAPNLEFVLVREDRLNCYLPMLVSKNLGDFTVDDSLINEDERNIAMNNFRVEAKKIVPYLWNAGAINLDKLGEDMDDFERISNRVKGADICYNNSRWDMESKKAYMIDTGKWKFMGLKYSN